MVASINKRAALEVKHQIPGELLGLLGTSIELTTVIDKHVKTASDIAGNNVPRSWEPKIFRYAIHRVKQAIFEKSETLGADWKPTRAFIAQVLDECEDAVLIAEDLMETIQMLTVYRRQAKILGAAS